MGLEFTDGGGVSGFFSDLKGYAGDVGAGANGGAQIYANSISFGATDAAGISHSSQFSGSEYTGSRIAGMVGATAVAVATGGAAAGGSAVAGVGISAITAKTAMDSAVDVGQGAAKIVNDPKSAEGYAQAAAGVVGLAATAVSVKAASVERVASEAPKAEAKSTVDPEPPTKVGTAGGERAGKDFTQAGKREVWSGNATEHGANQCENCGQGVSKPAQSQKGVTPPGNEGHVDHIIPKSQGGDGSPSNGQLLCRDCNLAKSDKPTCKRLKTNPSDPDP
jgi:hypothetical protein